MNYFDSDMSNSINTIVYFDRKDGNLYLRLRAMLHTIYAAKLEQTITHEHVLLRRESSLIDNNIVFHVLIAHRLFINFGYVDYFQHRCLKR